MKIITVIGARPQFVKAAVVSRAIKEYNSRGEDVTVKEVILHTGQHFDDNMSKVFFDQMGIPKPHYNLGINSLTHGAMTGKMLEEIEKVLMVEVPDWVLVYGDTNSTIAGALAAKKLHIKVAHVEAGLRSFNMEMPEEINRILTDRISDLLFCPTKVAMTNLLKEGFENMDIKRVNCGDVMYDAALYYRRKAIKPSALKQVSGFLLCTIHRQENTDFKDKLMAIFDALGEISEEKEIILPLHPRTLRKLEEFKISPAKNIRLIAPVGYLEMIWLLEHCSAVITDSGGLQKEAFFFKKPCITAREETEWVELLQHGVNFLAGADKHLLISTYHKIKEAAIDFEVNLYGTGVTGQQIVQELVTSDL